MFRFLLCPISFGSFAYFWVFLLILGGGMGGLCALIHFLFDGEVQAQAPPQKQNPYAPSNKVVER